MAYAHDDGPTRLTQRDLEFTPEDGNRYEIVEGVINETPPPSYPHQKALAKLFACLAGWVDPRGLGELFPAGLKVVLNEGTALVPDLVYVAAPRMSLMRRDGFYGPPDLVVEALSSRPQLDRVVKRQAYESARVAHYWMIDPDARTFEALELHVDHFRTAARLEGDAVFEPAMFAGLKVELRLLWV